MNVEKELIEKLRSGYFKGIVFDFDGTILDITGPLRTSIDEVFEYYKITGDMDTTIQEIGSVLESIQGYPLPKIVLQSYDIFKYISVLQNMSYLKKLRIAAKLFAKYLDYAEEAPIFPGIKPLLKFLKKKSDLYIVSHNQTKNIYPHLEREEIESFFKNVYGTDQLPALKPDPESLSPIINEYNGVKRSQFLMIGDMPSDIEAGKEAGFWTIAIASGISKREILEETNPNLIVESVSELLGKLDIK